MNGPDVQGGCTAADVQVRCTTTYVWPCGAAAWAHRCELIHVHVTAVTAVAPSVIPVGLVKAAVPIGAHDLG